MAVAFIGTSGWVYRHWRAVFYPPDLAPSERLHFYSRRFPSVEVNFSFYRLPDRDVFEAWRREVPASFTFAVKASRYITHMKRLRDCGEPLRRLLSNVDGLEDKLN